MRLERKKEEEISKRRGLTVKTLIQVVWLLISGVVAYFLLTYLEQSDEVNFSYGMVYNIFNIPGSVPPWIVLGGMILIFVLIMQLFLSLGFIIASPEGRRRTGDPSLHSRNKDPFDDHGY